MAEEETLIYEARKEEMVSQNDGESKVRIARFLKPCAKHVNQAVAVPNRHLLSEIFPHSLQHWPSEVQFKGWNFPQKRWKEWVASLAAKYGALWNQTGICDSIMSSIYEVLCNQDLVLGLSEFWCPETNSFVFPWGEATINLEDVMILGGFPVLGEPVTSPLTDEESVKIEEEMNKWRGRMLRSRSKKAGHSVWLKHFMEEEGHEFEHVAFLSLWLSRFVFPSLAKETVGKHVFPIAVRLSRGTPMALAPAVLGGLYRDLRLLKEQAMASKEAIAVSGPFQLLQLWAFEHFPVMGPNAPNSLPPGEPRVARWHKLSSKINLPLVRSALQVAENFQWRPYAANLGNWRHPRYYEEIEQFLFNSSSLDGELQSFLRCLQACELVGVDCKEKYLPHRVAMQFGMDQDLPADPSGFNFITEHVRFFVPPRSFQAGVSGKYMKWWKGMMLTRECAIKDVLVQKRYAKNSTASLSPKENGNEEDFHGPVASKNPINPMTLSQDSTKSSSEGSPSSVIPELPSDWSYDNVFPPTPHVSVSGHLAMKFKTSSSTQAKKTKGGCHVSLGKLSQVSTKSNSQQNHEIKDNCHASAASRTLKSPKKLSQVSKKPVKEERQELIPPRSNNDLQRYQDSNADDDFFVAKSSSVGKRTTSSREAFTCNLPRNVVSPTRIFNENCRKLKLCTKTEGHLQNVESIPIVNLIAEGVERKASHSANDRNGVAREAKRKVAELLRRNKKQKNVENGLEGDGKPLPAIHFQSSSSSAPHNGAFRKMEELMKPVEMNSQGKAILERPKTAIEDANITKANSPLVSIDSNEEEISTCGMLETLGLNLEARITKLEMLIARQKKQNLAEI